MAAVYILYSPTLNKYYIGSCQEYSVRLEQHLSKYFPDVFTSKMDDWVLYFVLNDLEYLKARKIELHIKKMKSRKFIENFKKFPEIQKRLIKKYA
jgi:putative endonuclease